jgi:3-carboxy-cis,cis-muconate cycloisomerase
MSALLSALAGDAEIEALLADAAQIAAMVSVELALASASAEAGLISAEAADAIAAAAAGFEPDMDGLAEGMERDGVVVPALVGQLRTRVAEPYREALHRGATSQDIIDTALMVQTGPILDIIAARLAALIDALAGLKAAHGGKTLMAHTRMQAALPTDWGAKLDSWLEPLQRYFRTIEQMRPSLLVVQLGGPVGDRASFDGKGDAIAALLAQRLGLGVARPWHTVRDPLVALTGTLALLTGTLGKIGADIALLSQTEVQALTLAEGGGSSSMAHKSNPVAAEILVALARQNAGLAGTMQQAMVHEYERSGAAWALEWLTLPAMFVATGASLRLALRICGQIRIA